MTSVDSIKKYSSLELYIKEGLVAMVPVFDNGDKSIIYTNHGKHHEPRSITWLVEKIARCYSIDFGELRRQCGEVLDAKYHIALPITDDLVLLPVKVRRQAYEPGGTTIGYISLNPISTVDLPPEGETTWHTVIRFKNGLELGTLNTIEKVHERIRDGKKVHSEFAQLFSRSSPYRGLTRQVLLEVLPNCECLLKDIFINKNCLDEPGEKI